MSSTTDPRITETKPRHQPGRHDAGNEYALAWSALASGDWKCSCRDPRREGHDINPPCEAVTRAQAAVDIVLDTYGLDRAGQPAHPRLDAEQEAAQLAEAIELLGFTPQPRTMDLRMMFQDRFWVSRAGRPILIGDMAPEYAANAARLLVRRAQEIIETQDQWDQDGWNPGPTGGEIAAASVQYAALLRRAEG